MRKSPKDGESSVTPVVAKAPAKKARKVKAKGESSGSVVGEEGSKGVSELLFPEVPSSGGDGLQLESRDNKVSGEGGSATPDCLGDRGEYVVPDSGAFKSSIGDASSDHSWSFLTNRTNLLSILGLGAVTRAQEAWRYLPDSRDAAAGAIPLWRGGIPRGLMPLLEKTGAEAPVILEFSDKLQEFLPRAEDGVCVVNGPLPFSAVSKVRFRDKKTLDDFKLKMFEDIPSVPDGLLFDSMVLEEGSDSVALKSPVVSQEEALRLDKVLGGVIAATESLEGRKLSARFYCVLIDALLQELRGGGSFAAAMAPVFSDSRASSELASVGGDAWLLKETLRVLSEIDPDAGLDPVGFVDQIETTLATSVELADGVDVSQLRVWCRYVRQLLEGSEELKPLSDAKSIVQRAVLLFLLRPEEHRFRKIDGSRMSAGDKVFLLASVFMGYFTGAQRSDTPIKRSGQRYFEMVGHILSYWRRGCPSAERVDLVQVSEGRGEFAVVHGSLVLARFEIEPSYSLNQVFNQIRRLGFNAQHDYFESEVVCTFSGQLSCEVRVSVTSGAMFGEMLRIYSECGRAPPDRERLGELAIMLLERNALPSIHGGFAISRRGRGIVYVQDQLLDTMDRNELEMHLRHVAETSAKLRSEIRGDLN